MDKSLCHRTAAHLEDKINHVSGLKAVVGLDAFIDEIIRVVDKRVSSSQHTTIGQIDEFGARIVGAAGRSTNFELVVERVKLGGNGPIMANALAALGSTVTCMAPFGEPNPHPAFDEIVARTRVITLGHPAHTDALEFEDGKLMVGKLEPLNSITWDRMVERTGEAELHRLLLESNLVALVNWTMIPAMTQIWRHILEVLSAMPPAVGVYFFDLADPEKHSHQAISEACDLIRQFQQFRKTLLGLNEKEAFLIGSVLGYKGADRNRSDVEAVATFISEALSIEAVVVHPRSYAVVACRGQLTASIDGPFTRTPKISTGAGDHFNAGFCLANILCLTEEEAIATANATSGYYVRNAVSPSLPDLIDFLRNQYN